jgi:dimethylamine--corrinoid protein Co-methyltransferase
VGVGDPFGMAITHAVASGMGGMRAAGDLVARMQIARGMKIDQAKKYVAEKLKVAVADLTDPIIMQEVRDDLGLGILHPNIRSPKCLEAKFNIARLLDIEINCVNRFKEKAAL